MEKDFIKKDLRDQGKIIFKQIKDYYKILVYGEFL